MGFLWTFGKIFYLAGERSARAIFNQVPWKCSLKYVFSTFFELSKLTRYVLLLGIIYKKYWGQNVEIVLKHILFDFWNRAPCSLTIFIPILEGVVITIKKKNSDTQKGVDNVNDWSLSKFLNQVISSQAGILNFVCC